jgi:hypothetical protein
MSTPKDPELPERSGPPESNHNMPGVAQYLTDAELSAGNAASRAASFDRLHSQINLELPESAPFELELKRHFIASMAASVYERENNLIGRLMGQDEMREALRLMAELDQIPSSERPTHHFLPEQAELLTDLIQTRAVIEACFNQDSLLGYHSLGPAEFWRIGLTGGGSLDDPDLFKRYAPSTYTVTDTGIDRYTVNVNFGDLERRGNNLEQYRTDVYFEAQVAAMAGRNGQPITDYHALALYRGLDETDSQLEQLENLSNDELEEQIRQTMDQYYPENGDDL